MYRTAIKWLSWLCVATSLLFILCGLSAIFNWFDPDTAHPIALGSAYTTLALGLGVLGCFLLDGSEDE